MIRLFLGAAALLLAACASTEPAHHDDTDAHAAVEASAADVYILTTCPVSGEALPAEGYATATVGDREARFCCDHCATMGASDPETWGPVIEQALIEAQVADYPLTNCAVMSSSALGSMGAPHDMLVGDTLVRLCCAGCAKAVDADPDKYVAMVAAARHQ